MGAAAKGAPAKAAVQMSGAVKSAVLLLSLEPEQSAELLKLLSSEQVRAITEAVAKLGEVGPAETEAVLEEFLEGLGLRGTGNPTGGFARARRLLFAAFGPETASKLAESLPRKQRGQAADLAALENADPDRLAGFLALEHPQTVALVLAHLSPEKASKILMTLPEERRVDVAYRVASMGGASVEIVGKIAGVLDQKLKSLGKPSAQVHGGVRLLADLLNRADQQAAEGILAQIEKKNEKTANDVRDLLFVFEDLAKLDTKSLKELVAKIDRKALTMALKGTSDEVQAKIFETMSKRGGELLREDMEALGPVKLKDVEAAQKEVIIQAREMEKEGVLSLSANETDQYVV